MFKRVEKFIHQKQRSTYTPVTKNKIAKQYQRAPSFSDLLPFVDFNDEDNFFLLEDGLSTGAVLQIRDFPSETMSQETLSQKHEELVRLLYEIMPLEEENPWVGQFFVFNEFDLSKLSTKLKEYVVPELKGDRLTEKYLSLCEEHFEALTANDGLFDDPLKKQAFRGGNRNIYFVLYRHYATKPKGITLDGTVNELKEIVSKVLDRLAADDFYIRQLTGKRIYEWLVKWFNPNPALYDGDVKKLLQNNSYPKKKPYGWSFTQNTLFGTVESDEQGFCFDGYKSKLLLVEKLGETPEIGCISQEKQRNKRVNSFIDKLPENAIYTLQIVFESQKFVKSHLKDIDDNAIGAGEEPQKAKRNVELAFDAIAANNGLFRTAQAIFIQGKDDEQLHAIEKELTLALADHKINLVSNKYTVTPVDNYLRFLPFNYRYDYDLKYGYYSQYLFASDIAALLPLYGRSRIDDPVEPLNIFFNRGGEPVVFDQYTTAFKQGLGASHEFLFGSTGAGKSVEGNHKVIRNLAIKNARVVVIEAGNSFGLTTQFVKEYGRKVQQINFDRRNPTPMNPYIEAYRALEEIEAQEAEYQQDSQELKVTRELLINKKAENIEKQLKGESGSTDPKQAKDKENRDLIAEMVMATRTMITCGDEKEEERLTQSDNVLIMYVIIAAIKRCKQEKKQQVLAGDVADEFDLFVQQASSEHDRARLSEMGRNLRGFITNPVRARFVNRPSEPLEDNDLLHIELGFLQENNPVSKSMLTLMAISILSQVLAMAEKHQNSSRPTVLLIDEVHILTKYPIIVAFLMLMSKLSRKYGFWLVLATQNLSDFLTVDALKILNMIETWYVMQMRKKERDMLNEHVSLSDEEKALIEKIFSPKGVYSEMVLLNPNHKLLMRHLPPRLLLALSMTEQDEKDARKKLMQQHGISEMQACEMIASQLTAYKAKANSNAGFELC